MKNNAIAFLNIICNYIILESVMNLLEKKNFKYLIVSSEYKKVVFNG